MSSWFKFGTVLLLEIKAITYFFILEIQYSGCYYLEGYTFVILMQKTEITRSSLL